MASRSVSRTGVSRAASRAGLGGQRQREVDPPHRGCRSAVHDPRGDIEVHGPASKRHRSSIQLRDGREVTDHVSCLPVTLQERGWWQVSGLAWSGRGRVARVDVSTDAGRSWAPAELQEPVLPKCHRRFRYLWQWHGAETVLMSRATDETGYVQPTLAELRKVRAWAVRTPSTTSGRGGCAATGPWSWNWRNDATLRHAPGFGRCRRPGVAKRSAWYAMRRSSRAVRVRPTCHRRRDHGLGHRRAAGCERAPAGAGHGSRRCLDLRAALRCLSWRDRARGARGAASGSRTT